MSKILELFRSAKYREAVAEGLKLLEIDGNDIETRLIVSNAYLMMEERTRAREILEEGLTKKCEGRIALALVELLLEEGETERARETAFCYITQGERNNYESDKAIEIAEAFVCSGQVAVAMKLYSEIEKRAGVAERDEIIERIDMLREAEPELAARADRYKYTEEDLEKISKLFVSREGVFARQTRTSDGKCGYVPVHAPLGKNQFRAHLEGEITLGVYPVLMDNTSYFLAFDIDVSKPYLQQFQGAPSARGQLLRALRTTVVALTRKLSEYGMRGYVEDSGNKGYHVWVFIREPVRARTLRNIARWILKRVEVDHRLQIEVFPRQDEVKAGSIGNLIKVPLGVHLKTGRRGVFVDPKTFEPYDDQIAFLRTVCPMSFHEFQATLASISRAVPEVSGMVSLNEKVYFAAAAANSEDYVDTLEDIDSVILEGAGDFNGSGHESAGDILRSECARNAELIGPVPSRISERVRSVVERCRVLDALIEKARESKELSNIERHVLIYLLTPLGNEGIVFIHQVLSNCIDYSASAVNERIRAVPPNPMSCPKVRKHLREIASIVGCKCRFELGEGEYPSPLIHAGLAPVSEMKVNMEEKESRRPVEVSETIAELKRLMEEYRDTRSRLEEMNSRLRSIERALNRVFDTTGGDVIRAAGEAFQRKRHGLFIEFIRESSEQV